MGRLNTLTEPSQAVKLHLVRLKMYDGDYDEGGAYWGFSPGNPMYCAFADVAPDGRPYATQVQVFVRGKSRKIAKENVRKSLPNARFYR